MSAQPTDRQLAYLRDLAARRGVDVPTVTTRTEASAAIDALQREVRICPKCGLGLVPEARTCPCSVWESA